MEIGVVKCFGFERGYGFIESKGKDYFFHADDVLANGKVLPVGAEVCFAIVIDSQGRPRATEVIEINPQESLSGWIVSYNPDRGFGFIESQKGRIFFHRTSLCGKTEPEIGMTVNFDLSRDSEGRKKAINIRSKRYFERTI